MDGVAGAVGVVAAGAVSVIKRESFTVTPWAQPHFTQLGCTSRPRLVIVGPTVGSPEYP